MVKKLPGKLGFARKDIDNWMGGATYYIDRRNYKVFRGLMERAMPRFVK